MPETRVVFSKPTPKPRKPAKTLHRVIVVPPNDSRVVNVDAANAVRIHGDIAANSPISFWLVDDRNLRKFEREQSFNFEEGEEDALEATLDADSGLSDSMNLVLANDDEDKQATVTIDLIVSYD